MSTPSQPQDFRKQELARALRLLAAGIDPQRVMEDMSRRLANKLLHRPLTVLRGILPQS